MANYPLCALEVPVLAVAWLAFAITSCRTAANGISPTAVTLETWDRQCPPTPGLKLTRNPTWKSPDLVAGTVPHG